MSLRKALLIGVVVVCLATIAMLAPGIEGQAEAGCWTCVNGNCESGGDGIFCREAHWSNGSSVCTYVDGCEI